MRKEKEPIYLPLDLAVQYLNEIKLFKVVDSIESLQLKFPGKRSRNIRKGIIVTELEKIGKLNEFCNKYWMNGNSDEGIKIIRKYKNALSNYIDNSESDDEDLDYEITGEVNTYEESSFAYEDDLRDYLANNLSLIEDGLKLYEDDNGIEGVEYSINDSNKRIDILAMDKNNIPVVIELKVKRGYEKVIGQCQYYKNRLKSILEVKNVRVIIIARTITDYLKTATIDLEGFELFEYELKINLKKINLE